MEESILRLHDKTTLKTMALENGLSRKGFNGRNASKMRKQDFIDFILQSSTSRVESQESSLEDEIINIFQELSPIIHIIGALSGFENVHFMGRRNESNIIKERVPKEDDETIPNLEIQELIKTSCDPCCKCETCEKNIDIRKENLKVKTNIHDFETKITCVICKDNTRNVLFKPCNHLATCISCSKNPLLTSKCPMCRETFTDMTRVFF
jgi:hypothetical protein